MDLTLEQKLVSGVVAFASEKGLFYSLCDGPLEKRREGKALKIQLGDYVQDETSQNKNLVEFATHEVIFNSKGEIIEDKTVSLSSQWGYRAQYIALIEYLNNQGAKLTYDYDWVWKGSSE